MIHDGRGCRRAPRPFVQGGTTLLRVIAPAKVNLFLGVGASRPDGYHDVTTVLHALELHDVLTISQADSLSVTCDVELGVSVADNLVHRAAVALARAFGREPNVRIAIEKRIPHGAGLGGGSSDAAATVAGLAALWGLDPGDGRCRGVAAALGADVPFFLERTGAALMTGRGDLTARVLPTLEGIPVALVKPMCGVSTAAAYRAFDDTPQPCGDPARVIETLESQDALQLALALENNMTRAASEVAPDVAEALLWTRGSDGVLGAAVAGSGSAVFALCESASAAQRVREGAESLGWWSEATVLRAHGVDVCEGDSR